MPLTDPTANVPGGTLTPRPTTHGPPSQLPVPAGPVSPEPTSPVGPVRRRGGLQLRLTLLCTALLALVSALMLALAYLLVGRVVAALPHLPPGTPVEINGVLSDAAEVTTQIVRQGRQTVLLVGFIAFPLLVIAGALVSSVLIGRALRPLSVLTTAARGLSESSLDQRILLSGPRDEVADLADTFDDMLDRLQAAFDAERRFVANASHELRTPLSVIRTEVDVTLADPGATVADLRAMGDVVREATDRADRLLSSLLFLARTQGSGISERRLVELADLVGPALHAVEAERASRHIEAQVVTESAPAFGDPALLERVVGNLVENAVRHNLPGGSIRVTTGMTGTDRVAAAGQPSKAFIEVRSGGTVIDPRTVAQLFEPFRQGERARTGHRGSGLGLSIVRAVVAAHGGTVTAAPVAEGGLIVRVELPTG